MAILAVATAMATAVALQPAPPRLHAKVRLHAAGAKPRAAVLLQDDELDAFDTSDDWESQLAEMLLGRHRRETRGVRHGCRPRWC